MSIRTLLAAASLVVASIGVAAPANATGCEPGDPNCHPGCDAINKTPIVNKIAQCNT